MNDNAKAWVAALRSGEYQQCKNVLYNGEGYCCLGVASKLYADVHGLEGFVHPLLTNDDGEEYDVDHFAFLGEMELLPREVQKWLGLTNENGSYEDESPSDLTHKNDNGATFAEIADIIESEPQGLFA